MPCLQGIEGEAGELLKMLKKDRMVLTVLLGYARSFATKQLPAWYPPPLVVLKDDIVGTL